MTASTAVSSAGPAREAIDRIVPVDVDAAAGARALQDQLTKPPGSLGRIEDLGAQLAAIAGTCPPPVPEPVAVAVFAGDHGVVAEQVTPWPSEVTAQMVANFLAGGAAINVFARQVGASVTVVDAGVASEVPQAGAAEGFVRARVRPGTGNIAIEDAMTIEEAWRALDLGAQVAADLTRAGARCIALGDMGIGNTTPSAALVAALCGHSPAEVTGRGTGIDDERFALKVGVVERALERAGLLGTDGVAGSAGCGADEVLAAVGGLEIAAIAGCALGAAARKVPVLVDGVIAVAGCVTASALAPALTGYLIAGHRSVEPGASLGLAHLGLIPVLDLDLRLGEGTGACLAVPVVQAAAKVLAEMATFDSAGVSQKE